MNKKILALLMALLMVVMSAVALAYDDYGDTLTITKEYKLTNETGVSPAETFDFSIVAEKADYPVVTISDPVFTQGAATTNGTTAEITLTVPAADDYGTPGEYLYTITEAESGNQGVNTITNEMTLKVTVLNESGTLVRVYSLKQNKTKTDELVGNEYSAGDLSIDKIVEGLMADRAEEFDVTVVLTAEEKIYVDLITVPAGATKVQTDENTITITGIKVSHNADDPVIEGIPYGTTYAVTENMTEAQKNVYDEDGSTTTANGSIEAAEETASLANVAKETEIDTGVFTDNMPYIMLMAFVMMIAAAVVLKKRTVNE